MRDLRAKRLPRIMRGYLGAEHRQRLLRVGRSLWNQYARPSERNLLRVPRRSVRAAAAAIATARAATLAATVRAMAPRTYGSHLVRLWCQCFAVGVRGRSIRVGLSLRGDARQFVPGG